MKRFFLLLLFAAGMFCSVEASTLSDVLNRYDTNLDILDMENYRIELRKAQEKFQDLYNDYQKDQFFEATEEIAKNMDVSLPNYALQLEQDKKYLISLVEINADLSEIWEAERAYRNTIGLYQEFAEERKAYDFAISGVTLEEVQTSKEEVSQLKKKASQMIYPDIGEMKDLQFPTSGKLEISSSFGYRENPKESGKQQFHNGIDLKANEGTVVNSVFSGKVLKAEFSEETGNCVLISHSNELQTFYADLGELSVQVGDYVSQNQAIGKMGKQDLHFAVFVGKSKVDPAKLFCKEVE